MLMYGRQPDPPKTLRREEDRLVEGQGQQEALDNWASCMDKLRELHDRARADAQAEQTRQAKYYDAHRRPPEFCLGDRVWKDSKVLSSAADGISAKLAPKYLGPYTIVNILGQNTYEIQGEDGQTIRPVHAQQLKRYVSAGKPRDYPDIVAT